MEQYDALRLQQAFPALAFRVYPTVDSTSSEARRQYNAGDQGPALYIAECQTAGRGRHGRSFYSPADTGIYMSLMYPVQTSYENARRATAKTAAAVCGAIRDFTALPAGIKWVNDVYLYGRKIVGILVESMADGPYVQALIIGIGINVTTSDFPEELKEKAGSLGKELDRTGLVIAVLQKLLPELAHLEDLSYLDLYRSASVVLGKKIVYENNAGEPVTAIAAAIDDDGALVVEKADGIRETLHSGEVSIRTPEGW